MVPVLGILCNTAATTRRHPHHGRALLPLPARQQIGGMPLMPGCGQNDVRVVIP